MSLMNYPQGDFDILSDTIGRLRAALKRITEERFLSDAQRIARDILAKTETE